MKVLVTGGGTAGHVLPALAIAHALRDRGHDVHLVGSTRGIEARLVPEAGFEQTLLPGRGIARRLTLANVGAVWGLFRALLLSFGLIRRHRPAVVIAVGGYASAALGVAAAVLRVPIIVHEQNANAGAANRMLATVAKACAVSFPRTNLPKSVVVGNPVRAELFESEHRPRPDQRTQVLVFGGSLGALSINRATLGAVALWRDRADLAVHHVIGTRDWPRLERPSSTGALHYVAVEYEDDMPTRLAEADLVVCRAGSSTCFELAAVGLASIIVPSTVTTGGQQEANAARVADVGGAVVIPDAELDAERLATEVDALVADPSRRAEMAAAVATLATPDAASRVVDLAEQHARD